MGLFLTYLKNPHYLKNENIEWSLFFKLLLSFYLISLPLGLIVGLLIKLLNFHDTELNFSPIKILFAGIVIGPIIEEVLFRLLLKPRYKNIIIFFGFSIWMIIASIIKENILYLIIFSIIGIVAFVFCLNKIILFKLQKFVMKHFFYTFYLSCFLFGFVHIANYQPANYKLILIVPILIFPQMIGGAFMGYIRMKFGIIYSILFHSIANLFPILALLFDK